MGLQIFTPGTTQSSAVESDSSKKYGGFPGSEEIIKHSMNLTPQQMRKFKEWKGGWCELKKEVEEKARVSIRLVEGISPSSRLLFVTGTREAVRKAKLQFNDYFEDA